MQTIRKQPHCLIVYELDSTIHPLPTIRRELIEAVSGFFQQQRARLGRVVKKPQSYYERHPVVEDIPLPRRNRPRKTVLRCRRCSDGGDVTVLFEHSHPAWGITLYAQCFVIDCGIPVVIATREQYENDFRYFVCQGKDRPLSSSSDEQGLELFPKRAACATGRVGRFT